RFLLHCLVGWTNAARDRHDHSPNLAKKSGLVKQRPPDDGTFFDSFATSRFSYCISFMTMRLTVPTGRLLKCCDEAIDDTISARSILHPQFFSIRQLLTVSGVTLVRPLPVAPLNFAR